MDVFVVFFSVVVVSPLAIVFSMTSSFSSDFEVTTVRSTSELKGKKKNVPQKKYLSS